MVRTACIALALLAACSSASNFRSIVAHERGAWTHEQIDATSWPDAIKAQCKQRAVLPGMTAEQVVASWGNPSSKAGSVWVYDEVDESLVDGNYIPQRSVGFDDAGLVLSVNSSG